MNSAVCTLFEADYHFGLAALASSLGKAGFKGNIWAGHRGALPFWASPLLHHENGVKVFSASNGININFIMLGTSAHLTNYKPDFMLRLLRGEAKNCEALFYFDPDIVVNENWDFFTDWVSCGVAVCEDVNSPVAIGHPRRIGWQRFFEKHSIRLHPREALYANGGFVGVSRKDIGFLEAWKRLQDLMWQEFGGAQHAGIAGGESIEGKSGFADCFGKTDQDALNAAIDGCGDVTVSFLNKQAMGFTPGKAALPHALGAAKPWRRKFIREAMAGRPPTAADKAYWSQANKAIQAYSLVGLGLKKFQLKLGAALGRFIRRG